MNEGISIKSGNLSSKRCSDVQGKMTKPRRFILD